MKQRKTSSLVGRVFLIAAPVALAVATTQVAFGCSSCEGPIAPYSFAPIGSTQVVVNAELLPSTTSYRWHCWGQATGPRVDAWTYEISWRVPGTAISGSDVSFLATQPTRDAGYEIAGACDSAACPNVVGPQFGLRCASDGLCGVPAQLDFEIRVNNVAAIPAAGLHSEFVITAGFFTNVASGGGGFSQPQPVGADLSDVTVEMNCVPAGQ